MSEINAYMQVIESVYKKLENSIFLISLQKMNFALFCQWSLFRQLMYMYKLLQFSEQ